MPHTLSHGHSDDYACGTNPITNYRHSYKTTNTNIHNSVPPEFRRARICNEEDVRLHPEKNCTTFATWKKEMAQYYKDGGGVEFDFSIEGKGGGPPQKYLMGD